MKKVIEVENLSFSYGNAGFGSEPILSKVSFSVLKGDFAGIIGSNGTGKSTLLRLLLGELTPTSGRILLLGEEISAFRRWHQIGYVPQSGAASASGFPATAQELLLAAQFPKIGLWRFAKKEHKERACHAMEQVGMQDFSRRMLAELSGGQKQRILIARALVNDPEMLLLDEPTNGVDDKAATALYELLGKLNAQSGIAVLMVTHDLARAARYMGRTFCLEYGSVVELDDEQIRHELSHKHKHPKGNE